MAPPRLSIPVSDPRRAAGRLAAGPLLAAAGLFAALAVTAAPPALAQTLDDPGEGGAGLNTPENVIRGEITGPQLRRLMEELGARPALSRDSVDDPMIDAEIEAGLPYTVFFYDCAGEEPRACESLLFYIGFALDERVTAEEINRWNAEQRFTRAYLDEVGDPVLEMDVMLYGGLSETALAERLRTWRLAVADFVEFLGVARY